MNNNNTHARAGTAARSAHTTPMSIAKLQRVMWRLRSRFPGQKTVLLMDLRRAIMLDCGTSEYAYQDNKKALSRLKWIRPFGRHRVELTGADLNGDA